MEEDVLLYTQKIETAAAFLFTFTLKVLVLVFWLKNYLFLNNFFMACHLRF